VRKPPHSTTWTNAENPTIAVISIAGTLAFMPPPGPSSDSTDRHTTPQTEATRVRLELARRIVDVYAANRALVAAGCCGSVARGTADEHSDLDLYLFWKRPQRDAFESPPLETIGGRRFTYTGIDENGDGLEQYFVDGIKVDITHELPALQEELTRDVFEHREISVEGLRNLASMAELIPLLGDSEIQRLRDQALLYPEDLAEEALRSFLHFPPIAQLRICRERQDFPGFADVLLRISGQAIACIAALDRQYFHPEAELKGALRVLDRCDSKPDRLAQTLETLLREPNDNSLADLRADLLELIAAVEKMYPRVPTDRARWLLDFEFDGSGS
jgi:hypothetical protein